MTTPSVPASPSVDAVVVLTTEDIMDITDITVGPTATNAVAAGADEVVEAGVVTADVGVANAASTLGPLEAILT